MNEVALLFPTVAGAREARLGFSIQSPCATCDDRSLCNLSNIALRRKRPPSAACATLSRSRHQEYS